MPVQRDSRKQRAPTANAADSLRREQPLVAALVEKATAREGCVLCHALQEVEERALFSFLYEGITTASAREEFVRGGGFCPRHFRMALRQTTAAGYVGPFEIGSVCQLLINAAMEKFKRSDRNGSRKKWSGLRKPDLFEHAGTCMLCADSRSKEKDLVVALGNLIADEAIAEHVEKYGLCQHHGSTALELWENTASREWLRQLLNRFLTRLKSDIDEFLRKHDYRFRYEPPGPEADAVQRALKFLLGLEFADEGEGGGK